MRAATRLLVAAAVTFGLAVGVSAQSRPTDTSAPHVVRVNAVRIVSIDGGANFQQYCAGCHGTNAKGLGPAARSLQTPPADLTLIVVRNGGEFPEAHIRESIRGNHPDVPLREMPDWNRILRSVSVDDGEATLRLLNLVHYIESVQQR